MGCPLTWRLTRDKYQQLYIKKGSHKQPGNYFIKSNLLIQQFALRFQLQVRPRVF